MKQKLTELQKETSSKLESEISIIISQLLIAKLERKSAGIYQI